MTTATKETQFGIEATSNDTTGSINRTKPSATAHRLSGEQVWHAIEKGSFAVISYVTPAGEPRSSGVMCKTVGRRVYVVVAPDSWKARHIALSGKVAVTVTVRRGGLLSLVFPIPPATISFHGTAIVLPPDSSRVRALTKELAPLLPKERQASASVIEIVPHGAFVTYGLRVSLNEMRDPYLARARVLVDERAADERKVP